MIHLSWYSKQCLAPEKQDDQLVLVNCVWPLPEKPLDQPEQLIYVWPPVSKQMQKAGNCACATR